MAYRFYNFQKIIILSLLLAGFFSVASLARADTMTFYAAAGDGYVGQSFGGCDQATWSSIRNSTFGNSTNYTNSVSSVRASQCRNGLDVLIRRAFFPFDTSALPDGAIVTAATLNMYVSGASVNVNELNDGNDFLSVVRSNQVATAALSNNDYGITDFTEGSNRLDITSLPFDAWASFALNAAGRSWISSTGNTFLALLEGHDTLNVYGGAWGMNQFGMRTSNYDVLFGPGSAPYLTVTYSVSASDTVAPAAVSNLAASNPTVSSISLSWTAPGDDGAVGTATSYDMRYSTSPITAANFSSATQVSGEPAPLVAGSAQSMTVSGLSASTLYYFVMKTSDEVPNPSLISNVPSGSTLAPSAPTFTTPLAANPTSIVSGAASTLTWASSGADSCSASANPANGAWTGAKALNGSQSTGALTVTTVFTITCTNAGGSTPSSATVTVTPPPNVSGHAWAGSGENDGTNSNPGIGWISFSSRNCDADGNGFSDGVGTCPSTSTAIPSYGVLVSSASPGVLSGYAWANPNDGAQNHIGWIDFGPAGAYPASSFVPAQSARLNRTTGLVSGWARACSVFASGCSGALRAASELGGWDGWIGFGSGGNYTQPVMVSGCNWSGYAWGGGINIGWIHFGGALYPITGSGDACATVTPQCSDGIDNDGDGLVDLADPGCINPSDTDEAGPIAPSGLSANAGSGASCNAMVVTWTDNSTDESRFELERKLSLDPDTAYVEIAEPSVNATSFTDTGAVGGLSRNTSYAYRIRACNAFGCGAYSNTNSAINQNPLPSFTWTPPSPLQNANTTFNASASTIYGGASASEYFWTFADGVPATFCSSVAGSGCNNPPLTSLASTRFQLPPSPEQKSVIVRVTDSASRSCSLTQTVSLRTNSTLPRWREEAPE